MITEAKLEAFDKACIEKNWGPIEYDHNFEDDIIDQIHRLRFMLDWDQEHHDLDDFRDVFFENISALIEYLGYDPD